MMRRWGDERMRRWGHEKMSRCVIILIDIFSSETSRRFRTYANRFSMLSYPVSEVCDLVAWILQLTRCSTLASLFSRGRVEICNLRNFFWHRQWNTHFVVTLLLKFHWACPFGFRLMRTALSVGFECVSFDDGLTRVQDRYCSWVRNVYVVCWFIYW